MYRALIVALVVLAACKPVPYPDERMNKWEDAQLVKIYELQDRRNALELIPFLKAKAAEHRAQAALAFASIQDSAYLPYLAQVLTTDRDAGPRKAAALAIGQLQQRGASKVLLEAFASEISKENQEVILESLGKCIDLRGLTFLTQFKPQEAEHRRGWLRGVYQALLKRQTNTLIVERCMELVRDPEPEVATLAAHYLFLYQRRGNDMDPDQVRSMAEEVNSPEARDRLLLILEDRPDEVRVFGPEWIARFDSLTSPYDQAGAIAVLDPVHAMDLRPQLSSYLQDSTFQPVVKNAALEKLIEIEEKGSYYPEFIHYELLRALRSGDMAQQSIAALAMLRPEFSGAREQVDTAELMAIRDALILPQQVETYADLSRLIAVLTDTRYESPTLAYGHPIDWDHVVNIPREQQVRLLTSKGEIILQCAVEDAPGSVSNFLKLVDSGFYNDKVFHRVVPNFVIQGGCPRGDGWGALNWVQRSEFSHYQRFTAGAVGLASSGKDTEGVQFFITPCGTPMLNGRYSLFARVVRGMEVVQSMEVGDLILSAERI